ncbi:S8 family serine peptidase [Plantactinospora sp. GCM10030261]|uniref:S8 family serine peptidase n=1 Tax=Plantactinospora sp. GCM10030261 TaxID=3273420 RepID=UPI00361E1965
MVALDLVRLPPLMARSVGTPDVVVGLLDGPVPADHPGLAGGHVRTLPGHDTGRADPRGPASRHATFVAGILVGHRDGPAPAICPGCRLLVRPIFGPTGPDGRPSATPRQVAMAITECVRAGARVVNLSAGVARPSTRDEQELRYALDFARRRGVIVVVAAGNQATVGGSAITRHPWVVPVASYGLDGRPSAYTNVGAAVGRRGLGAPGEGVTSLGPDGAPVTSRGTSVAAAFVTGATALLWSLFPAADAGAVWTAVVHGLGRRRVAVVPPLLDAWDAFVTLSSGRIGREVRV